MGMFSFKCAKSRISIPAYPYASLPREASNVIAVLPNNTKIEGIYGGYGDIGSVDIYEELAKIVFKNENAKRDWIFEDKLRIVFNGEQIGVIEKFYWNEPIKVTDKFEALDAKYLEDILGKSLNQLLEKGYSFKSLFDDVQEMIKIVRADHYSNETFEELPLSKSCSSQGYFYKVKDRNRIIKSLNGEKV